MFDSAMMIEKGLGLLKQKTSTSIYVPAIVIESCGDISWNKHNEIVIMQ